MMPVPPQRKRTAEEAELDFEALDAAAKSAASKNKPSASSSRAMQGDGGDGKKHSLDSDEEEDFVKETKPEAMDEEDIEGQEDDTIENDEGVKITPFNLKEEHEEGEFTKDGAFIWKKEKEINDAWLDNVDWVKVKQVSKAEQSKNDANDDAEDEAEAAYNETETYKKLLPHLKPGETVAKAIRRLGGGGGGNQKILQQKQRKIAQKLKKGTKLTPDEESFKQQRDEMEKLTGLADAILSRSGNMEVYEETYEKIAYDLKLKAEEEKPATVIPDDVEDDDALDMFADSLDSKTEAAPKASSEKPAVTEAAINLDDEVKWELKWEDSEDAEIHGPHSSTEMLKWQESGYFSKGVHVRKVGTKEFLDGKRIDFDLYT